MTSPWLTAITVGPLALYFWVLGSWQGGTHPRVVSGLLDYLLLVFGLGGIIAFGPFGQYLTRALFGQPGWLDWLTFLSGLGLIAGGFARRSLRKAVVYHVDRRTLFGALEATLREFSPDCRKTLSGFEQPRDQRWIVVEMTPWLKTGVVEVQGEDAERFLQNLRRGLQARLRAIEVKPSVVSTVFRGLAVVVLLTPILSAILTQPSSRAALRALRPRFWVD